MTEDAPVVFSCSHITPESKLGFEELLGKGEVKSSQPKRKAEDGEIEDSPITQDYPLKVPRKIPKAEIRETARQQRERSEQMAFQLLRSPSNVYVEAVVALFLQNNPKELIEIVCICCHEDFDTWDENATVCASCEDAFLALVEE